MKLDFISGNIDPLDVLLGIGIGIVFAVLMSMAFDTGGKPIQIDDLPAIEKCEPIRNMFRTTDYLECLELNGLKLVQK